MPSHGAGLVFLALWAVVMSGNPTVETFHHGRRHILQVIVLLTALLAVLIIAVLFGPGFDADGRDPLWATISILGLLSIIGGFTWLLRLNPRALEISDEGILIPLAFRRPLRWDEIHRIRRSSIGGGLYGKRDWLIVDPSPGVLAPLRLSAPRRLELWFQKQHGVRIPLHALDGDPEDVVRSIERYRPVMVETD